VTSRPCPDCGGVGTKIRNPCHDCAGDGRVRARRTITVKVPAGVDDGMRLRLSGEGEVGPGGGPPGDLYVEIRERPHPVFTRDGDDLHCRVELPMTAAALGTEVTLTTLDGEEALSIKPGTQAGTVQTLRGRGVPHLNRGVGRGDLHVHYDVLTPTKLDEEQQRLMQELARARGEETPSITVTNPAAGNGQGLFSRLRDAFK
ncbi:MAG TPA: DnaJ C-terminal domain-containing protein, partial [Mycobacteriales bacterium]|nr:DnaJ C-terminal domain-containing protein [Mycobacteriales bacterium]